MIEGGADIARLGLELDGREFIRTGEDAALTLEKLGDAGDDLAASLGRSQDAVKRHADATLESQRAVAGALEEQARVHQEAVRERAALEEQAAAERTAAAARYGQDQALAQVLAMESVFNAEMARIQEASARGLLTPEQAKDAARQAAEAFNAELLSVIDQTRESGALSGDEGQGIYAVLAGSLKNVDEQGRRAAIGVGRLNQTLTSTLRQVAGLNPAVAQLVNAIGGLALGGAMMTGVLAGLAAVSVAWNRMRAGAREAREEYEEALRTIEAIVESQRAPGEALSGTVAVVSRRVQEAREEADRLLERLERLRAAGERGPVQGSSLVGRQPLEVAGRARLDEIERQYQEELDRVAAGEREITRLQERSEADRLSRLIAANQATRAERERAAQFVEELQARLAAASTEGTFEDQTERVRLIELIDRLTGAFERRSTATDRAAESSRRMVADLARQVEEEERLLAAARQGAEAFEVESRAIERANAIRDAGAQATAGQRQEAEALAAALFDLREAREAELEAQERAAARAAEDRGFEELRRMDELTREFVGTSEELAEAQRDLATAFADRSRVEQLVADGWDPAEAQARVEAERAYSDSIRDGTEALRARERAQAATERIGRELRDMERLVAIYDEFGRDQRRLKEAVDEYNRAIAERAVLERIVREGVELDDPEEFARQFVAAAEAIRGLGDEGEGAARRTQQAFAAALGAISTGAEGVAGQLASIAQAGLAGGPVGAIGATLGAILRMGSGSSRAREQHEEAQRRMAEEAERAAEALAEFARRLDMSMEARRAALDFGDREAAEVRFRQQQDEERRAFTPQFEGLVPGTEEFEAAMARWVELLWLQERELQAFLDAQEKAAEREAAQRAQQLADFELDMGVLRATLDGDDLRLAALQLEAQRDRELRKYRELYEAGTITSDMLEEMEELLGRRLAEALDDAAMAVRRAAEAERERAAAARQAAMDERLRQATDEERLRIQLLRAQGYDAEARAAENALALEVAMREGRSQNYLTMLAQLQALDALNRSQEEAVRGVRSMNDAIAGTARVIGGPSGFNNRFLMFSTARRLDRDMMGGPTMTMGVAPASQSFTVQMFGTRIESIKDPEDLLNRIEGAAVRRAASGGPVAFVSPGMRF